ncbi:2-dehydro-3-deoxy-D-arabinonate dehydratase [Singulisphaera sp. GP187]|uniref:fumarylacetoacetate hydrolase family protein n=1 Tax=Singulisphaera sp. GP187 TaxID=1882752 RepID=UPI000926702A|nr:fumarylacetoacetate hydrolase family protein [Singulisphaera sp. GP187]SIO62281.1 2-dehydro-3-deoxy-D-arabinonate dehydratase [Singulisphaera sp. GP187]
MRIAKYLVETDSTPTVGLVNDGRIVPLGSGATFLSDLLQSPDLEVRIRELSERSGAEIPLERVRLLAPLDAHEVWGAGVTYERSKVARQEESEQGGSFYDLVYRAERPELFFKATPSRVVGPGVPIRVRADTRWCVPEPELALVLTPDLRLVGYTVGNDVSARDIEGENPLYLPQAKVYDASCALGPWITLASAMPPIKQVEIRLTIERHQSTIFEGRTSLERMARRFEDLIGWLGRDNQFPSGVILLTGTGIVPPDEFSLREGDLVRIDIDGIGSLVNPATQSKAYV